MTIRSPMSEWDSEPVPACRRITSVARSFVWSGLSTIPIIIAPRASTPSKTKRPPHWAACGYFRAKRKPSVSRPPDNSEEQNGQDNDGAQHSRFHRISKRRSVARLRAIIKRFRDLSSRNRTSMLRICKRWPKTRRLQPSSIAGNPLG